MSATAVGLVTSRETGLEKLGAEVSRYGLVLVLLLIGLLKFTAEEAAGIKPLVEHSPLMSWMYRVLSLQGVSNLIGMTELVIAALIAVRPWSAKASYIGSIGAVATFLTTISFIFSTPGALTFNPLPMLGGVGQFIIKDVVLLGAAIWTAAEAKRAIQ